MGAKGKVVLLGVSSAGLLSSIARRKLKRADVVVCDRLIDAQVLAEVDKSKIVYVGKGVGRGINQSEINRLLIEQAKSGKVVVRVKGGDSFIFGRGGEEIEALLSADIEFEVFPGITAASLAGAYSGIPLTHRDVSSSVCLVAGHRRGDACGKSEGGGGDLDLPSLARSGTIVLYMSVGQMRSNMEKLVAGGVEKDRPVAVVERAGTGLQRVVVGTVCTIAELCAQSKPAISAPSVVIVGDVVGFRKGASWFERKPLFGQVVVVTRPACRSRGFYDKLVELGAYVLPIPAIEYEEIEDYREFDEAISEMIEGRYDWVIFTSQKSVEVLLERLRELNIDVRGLAGVKIGVIGRATAELFRRYFVRVDLMPRKYVSESLGRALIEIGIEGKRVLMFRTDVGTDELSEMLEGAGADVRKVLSYKVRVEDEISPVVLADMERIEKVDWVTFTSPSVVRGFWGLMERYGLSAKVEGAKFVSIGPVTTKELIAVGKSVFAEAEEHTIEGMIKIMSG